MKLQFLHMITDAIFHLGERKGSSREAIWKYLQTKYPASVGEKKIFLVQMRRIAAQGIQVEKSAGNQNRFRLNKTFREKYIKHLAKGEEMHLAQKHAMTTKTKNKKKAASKMKKATKSKTAKGRASIKKSKAK